MPNNQTARVTTWRDAKAITLYIRSSNLTANVELPYEDAARLRDRLTEMLDAPGPRVGTPADLGCEVL